jgi:hypothetical protein
MVERSGTDLVGATPTDLQVSDEGTLSQTREEASREPYPPVLLALMMTAGAGIPSFVVLAMGWGITEGALRLPGAIGTVLGVAAFVTVIPLILLFVALIASAYAQYIASEQASAVAKPLFIVTGLILWGAGLVVGFWYLGMYNAAIPWLAIPGVVFALGGGLPVLAHVSLKEPPEAFGSLGSALVSVLTIGLTTGWIVSVLVVLIATVTGWDGANQYAFLFVVAIFLLPVIQAILVLIGLLVRPVGTVRNIGQA